MPYGCPYTKPDVGRYSILQPTASKKTRVTAMAVHTQEIFVGLECGNSYLVRHYNLTKKITYEPMPGPIDHVRLECNYTFVTSGTWIRVYEKLDGKEFWEHNLDQRIVGFMEYVKTTVITEKGVMISLIMTDEGLQITPFLDLGGPISNAEVLIYDGAFMFEEREPIIALYRNWFAMIDIAKNKRELMKRFTIPDISHECDRTIMVISSQYLFFCNRVHMSEDLGLLAESRQWTPIKYIPLRCMITQDFKSFQVYGQIVAMTYSYGLLLVSLTTRRVEIYNATTLLKHHVFLCFEMVTCMMIVDNVLICGTENGNLYNFRLGDKVLCEECDKVFRREMRINPVVCYTCVHKDQPRPRGRRISAF